MGNRPKIMHIITRLDMGGSAQNTLLTCLWLTEKYDLVLVHGLSLESQMTDLEKNNVNAQIDAAKRKGVNVIPLKALVRKINPFQDICAFISLWRLIFLEKPEIVHTHSSKAGILGRLAAKLTGVPIIVHTPHGHVFYGHFDAVTSRIFLTIEKIFDLITDCTIALTEGEKRDYIDMSVTSPNKLHTIHSGVDIERFRNDHISPTSLKQQLGISPKSLIVGTVGWLLPIKGPTVLLEAMMPIWQKQIDAVLIYVGKGELERPLKKEVDRRNIKDKVIFLGWRNDVDKIMSIFDVFVLPSLNEGMGRVLVEAMAAGKPVVASDVGGIPDIVKHRQTGFLSGPGNVDALSYYIEKLLLDEPMRAEMGHSGRKMSQDFSVKKMIARIDTLYLSLLKRELICY